ncbi:MAG: carbamoyltransferase HypF, partial [Anaerolineae bacterium]|nr:carbamoyltransferase HypF [Anaerolineae bacterium]
PLAIIEQLAWEALPLNGETSFRIETSRATAEKQVLISPDVCVCADCLQELFDPVDRRYGYPFINCTNCGPRFTIIQDVPYDRDQTTMQVFPMCPDCRAEYDDPLDRRFHAQPNACPVCGPQASLLDAAGVALPEADSMAEASQRLADGKILAIKGLGGYHLACDALNSEAVTRLRRRKQREEKPFALMVADLETAHRLCYLDGTEVNLLQSRQRPIVLLRRREGCAVAADVAPNHNTLGLMLPYTPLHALLLAAFRDRLSPADPAVLVMTSGNLSDEPIAYQDDEALGRLGLIADSWLTHNRDIHIRCDDSITRVVAGVEQVFRRSRGYVPRPIRLSQPFPQPLLACGGHLKNTFCLGKGQQAFVSHHIGDLENLETLTSFRDGIEHFKRLFDIQPEAIAYDLHPEYLATKYALDSDIVLKIGVQHHHAHIAGVMAEHGLTEPMIGLAADGTGYGLDGAVWGGEVLVADLGDFERVAHLDYVPLPGGAQAIRQPWRMAAVYLWQAYGDDFLG